MSTIAPSVTNTGTIEVTSGTLDFGGGISGTGSDTISGASTLEFDANVSAGQTVSFTGSGGELALHEPGEFAGSDQRLRHGRSRIERHDRGRRTLGTFWLYGERRGHEGTLGFKNGASTLSLTLLGDYTPADFVPQTQANGSTLITYKGVSGLDSLLPPVSGAETHAGEFGIHEASTGSARGDWGAGASWDGSVGHGPGPS